MAKSRIIIINGSHRQGNTDLAVEKVKKEISSIADEVKVLTLRSIEMKMPDGCSESAEGEICPHIKDQFSKEIEPTLRNYDIYILATPTWSDNVTPLTKIFWDRIVSWCAEGAMYLKGKKLGVITHGMADEESFDKVAGWVKGVSVWEECIYVGALTFKSGSKIGDVRLSDQKIRDFIKKLGIGRA